MAITLDVIPSTTSLTVGTGTTTTLSVTTSTPTAVNYRSLVSATTATGLNYDSASGVFSMAQNLTTTSTPTFGKFLELESTDAGATQMPVLSLYRNSGSPADNDEIGAVRWFAENESGEKKFFGQLNFQAEDVQGSNSQSGKFILEVANDDGRETADSGAVTDVTTNFTQGLEMLSVGQNAVVIGDSNALAAQITLKGDTIKLEGSAATLPNLYFGTSYIKPNQLVSNKNYELPSNTGTLAITTDITGATTVGTLNSGAISSGFGNIDNGSSSITTTGTITGGTITSGGTITGNKVVAETSSTNSSLDVKTSADGPATLTLNKTSRGTLNSGNIDSREISKIKFLGDDIQSTADQEYANITVKGADFAASGQNSEILFSHKLNDSLSTNQKFSTAGIDTTGSIKLSSSGNVESATTETLTISKTTTSFAGTIYFPNQSGTVIVSDSSSNAVTLPGGLTAAGATVINDTITSNSLIKSSESGAAFEAENGYYKGSNGQALGRVNHINASSTTTSDGTRIQLGQEQAITFLDSSGGVKSLRLGPPLGSAGTGTNRAVGQERLIVMEVAGNAFTLTQTNGPFLSAQVSTSIVFDAVGDYIRCVYSDTASAWILLDSGGVTIS